MSFLFKYGYASNFSQICFIIIQKSEWQFHFTEKIIAQKKQCRKCIFHFLRLFHLTYLPVHINRQRILSSGLLAYPLCCSAAEFVNDNFISSLERMLYTHHCAEIIIIKKLFFFADIDLNTCFNSFQGPNSLNNVILYLLLAPFNVGIPFL